MNQKLLFAGLALAILFTFPLVANGSGDKGSTAVKASVNPEGVFPIVDEEMTISVLLPRNPLVDDYQNNDFVNYTKEKTNIFMEIDSAPAGNDFDQKKNLLLASGDYPEVIIDGNFSKAQQVLYGNQGVFLPLNDYIDTYGVNTRQVFSDYPEVKKNFTLPDGSIYALPDVNDCFHCSMAQKMWVYTPWLDKLGLDMPETTEEFKEMLIAFRDQDPNGNGKKDEIPLSGAIAGWFAGVDGFLMNSFVYTHGNLAESTANRLYVNKGKIVPSYTQPAWKEGLLYINDLFEEGLLSGDAFVQDANQYKQLGENADDVIMGAGTGGHMGVFVNFQGESGRWLEYKAVPPLKGPEGVRYARYNPVYGNFSWFITNTAKNPEAAFRLGDAFYDIDMVLRNIYGREGIDWDYGKPGEIGINGKPAVWNAIVGRNDIGKTSWWNQVGPQARSRDFRLGRVMQGPEELEVILFEETKNKMEPYAMDAVNIVPPLSFAEEDAAELVELENNSH
jgi:putative aldouronate transport system substrate-binding protein